MLPVGFLRVGEWCWSRGSGLAFLGCKEYRLPCTSMKSQQVDVLACMRVLLMRPQGCLLQRVRLPGRCEHGAPGGAHLQV